MISLSQVVRGLPPERDAAVEQQLREELEMAWIAYQQAPRAEKAEAKKRYLAALLRFTELVLRF